jgi:hypothetical protein
MGQIVKLIELVGHLAELDDEDTIYAREPWTEDSDAMVAREDPDRKPYGIPLEAAEAGLAYFLEVFIARDEVLEGWIASLDEKPTLTAICQQLIYYATYDAFLEEQHD